MKKILLTTNLIVKLNRTFFLYFNKKPPNLILHF